jgi:hypothetical protein
MALEYSVGTVKALQERLRQKELHRPMRVDRFEPGQELSYSVRAVGQEAEASVRLTVDRFVGGGFAGQVYRVMIKAVEGDALPGLDVGTHCAMKIMIPPSRFSKVFRDALYWIGFQGPFQLQVNPTAARAGALWQKFIRRAAQLRFGDEGSVVDIHATFVDPHLGSCGELSEWVEGRTWLLEVDDRLDLLGRWGRGKAVDEALLGSHEYRAKHNFMHRFVELLHDMGAHEFARQYEWSTCKSQPNCLKRKDSGDAPDQGLTAVDFRAGLVLLPYLPMSPGDFKLIGKGVARGSLVQFDRGSLEKLKSFMESHAQAFSDMHAQFAELQAAEALYRNSLPDVTHNGLRLLYSPKLLSTIFDSAVTGWRVRNLLDDHSETRLRQSCLKTFLFLLLGIIPFLGRGLRKWMGRADWRKHYHSMLSSGAYLKKALHAKALENIIKWHRAGRVTATRAESLAGHTAAYLCHLPLSLLPAGLHHVLTDGAYAKERLSSLFVRPIRLYFNGPLREQWLRDMVTEGQNKHMLTDEDAQTILEQMNEPFIQKYLKSLAVHVCTLPVTQVVSVAVAIWYKVSNQLSWGDAWGQMLLILAAFQVVPISPGSICRGLYVLYLVIRERNFKDYNIAVFLGFFKYVGYLAFPIQMTHHYPALARFMAGHWATEAVHIVPVFGERGALLEHWVFNLFYNWPLTIRKRMNQRAQIRARQKPRYWHVLACSLMMAATLGFADRLWRDKSASLSVSVLASIDGAVLDDTEHLSALEWADGLAFDKAERRFILKMADRASLDQTEKLPMRDMMERIGLTETGQLPSLKDIWWLIISVGLAGGSLVTLGCRGATLGQRIVSTTLAGLLSAAAYTYATMAIAASAQIPLNHLWAIGVWRIFVLAILAVIGTMLTEIQLPYREP